MVRERIDILLLRSTIADFYKLCDLVLNAAVERPKARNIRVLSFYKAVTLRYLSFLVRQIKRTEQLLRFFWNSGASF